MKNFAIIIIYNKKDGRSRLDVIVVMCVTLAEAKHYLPMQNLEKMVWRMSSEVMSPVISPR